MSGLVMFRTKYHYPKKFRTTTCCFHYPFSSSAKFREISWVMLSHYMVSVLLTYDTMLGEGCQGSFRRPRAHDEHASRCHHATFSSPLLACLLCSQLSGLLQRMEASSTRQAAAAQISSGHCSNGFSARIFNQAATQEQCCC